MLVRLALEGVQQLRFISAEEGVLVYPHAPFLRGAEQAGTTRHNNLRNFTSRLLTNRAKQNKEQRTNSENIRALNGFKNTWCFFMDRKEGRMYKFEIEKRGTIMYRRL